MNEYSSQKIIVNQRVEYSFTVIVYALCLLGIVQNQVLNTEESYFGSSAAIERWLEQKVKG